MIMFRMGGLRMGLCRCKVEKGRVGLRMVLSAVMGVENEFVEFMYGVLVLCSCF